MKMCLVILGVSVCVGCGYRLGTHYEASLPFEIKRVAVPLFANGTFESHAEVPFTKALRQFLLTSRGVRIVDQEEAEAVVRGRIQRLTLTPIAFPVHRDGAVSTSEWRIDVSIDIQLIDTATGEVLWGGTDFSDFELYLAHEQVTMTESNKTRALSQLAHRLMGQVHRSMVEGF